MEAAALDARAGRSIARCQHRSARRAPRSAAARSRSAPTPWCRRARPRTSSRRPGQHEQSAAAVASESTSVIGARWRRSMQRRPAVASGSRIRPAGGEGPTGSLPGERHGPLRSARLRSPPRGRYRAPARAPSCWRRRGDRVLERAHRAPVRHPAGGCRPREARSPDAGRRTGHVRAAGRELKVALAAAEGASPRQIAERLLLGPRTVGPDLRMPRRARPATAPPRCSWRPS